MNRGLPPWSLIGWCALVVALTLAPASGEELALQSEPLCLFCGERWTADAILNLFLFIPFGALLAHRAGAGRAAGLGFLFSLAIEIAQAAIPGRYPSLSDLVFNTAGSAVGALMGYPMILRIARGGAAHRAASIACTAASLVVIGFTALALEPSLTDDVFFGQWTPDLSDFAEYEGRVLQATIGGLAVRSGSSPDSDSLRSLLREHAPIEVRFVLGRPPDGLAPIFNIFDASRRRVLILGADGGDLVFRRRFRADDLRLDRPDHRVPGALEGFVPGDTVAVRVAGAPGGGFWVDIAPGGSAPEASPLHEVAVEPVADAVGRGWSLLLFADSLGPATKAALDLIWLAALAFPLGLLAGGRLAALEGAVLLLAAAIVPAVSFLGRTPWEHYGWLVVGILLGRWARAAICPHWPPAIKSDMVPSRPDRASAHRRTENGSKPIPDSN